MTITTDRGTELSNPNTPESKNGTAYTKSGALILGGSALGTLGAARSGWQRLALITSGVFLAYQGLQGLQPRHGHVRVSYTINRLPEEVYEFVRSPENWPGVENADRHQISLAAILKQRLGFNLGADVQVTDRQDGKFIAWSSHPGSIEHRGVVHFRPAPAGRGCELSIALEYKIPGRIAMRVLAAFQGKDPEQLIRENLRALKQKMEAGEVPTTLGQPSGARGLKGSALRVIYREQQAASPQKTQLAGD